MAGALPRCAICRVRLRPDENVVVRSDRRFQHATCPKVVCAFCATEIGPDETVRPERATVVHTRCAWKRYRQIRGAS
jgi:hypothetical protein